MSSPSRSSTAPVMRAPIRAAMTISDSNPIAMLNILNAMVKRMTSPKRPTVDAETRPFERLLVGDGRGRPVEFGQFDGERLVVRLCPILEEAKRHCLAEQQG